MRLTNNVEIKWFSCLHCISFWDFCFRSKKCMGHLMYNVAFKLYWYFICALFTISETKIIIIHPSVQSIYLSIWLSICLKLLLIKGDRLKKAKVSLTITIMWAPSSEFVSSSIPSWQISTAHVQPFRGARDLAFCLRIPLDSLLVWASSGGSGETARMRSLAWTFAARIGDKYQIRLTRSNYNHVYLGFLWI